jgi:ABC-type branched-subunit amino acid transport system ATPase component
MGLARIASGAVRFDGKLISGLTPEQIARAGIGLVPQGRRLFPGLTVAGNLRLGLATDAGKHISGQALSVCGDLQVYN